MRVRAKEIIGRLDAEPALGKRLRGRLEGKRSARLGRSHRIVCTLEARGVIVLGVKQRKDAYR